MATIIHNLQTAPVLEIPTPPEELGKDGGKFYHAYDTIAAEVDEDMTASLKEQLDGMLVFAGLFAGVNTAFLALTIPLLSVDPSEDTNALLVQNNAILLQLAMGTNDTFLSPAPLPSTGFSPSNDVFAINALFALSLAFAIISSFLAVLGRQWLVYYRKRSGGGPDRQRWEQLKRFLGAQRWHMELVLDDVLPSLLQVGLIIFCISLIIYLHYLSPALSVIVGIPLYLGLAIFIGSALCTLWDRFCPFHSPLSHLLCWSVQNIPPMLRAVWSTGSFSLRGLASQAMRGLKQCARWIQCSSPLSGSTEQSSSSNYSKAEMKLRYIRSAAPSRRWLEMLKTRRKEETPESLQVIAIQRAICTSDDPMTLLYATANILGIRSVEQMELLWGDSIFQERFLQQFRNSYPRMLQLGGYDQIGLATLSRRLYCGAAAHIMLFLDHKWNDQQKFVEAIRSFNRTMVFVPDQDLLESSACMARTGLGFTLLQFCTYFPLDGTVNVLINYLASSSNRQDCQDWRLLCIISWVISNLMMLGKIDGDSVESLRKAYRGDKEDAFTTLEKAFEVLVGQDCRDLVDADRLLISLLQYIDRAGAGAVAVDQVNSELPLEHKFALLESCEPILQSPQTLEAARQIVRKLRFDLARVWLQEYMVWVGRVWNTEMLLDILEGHLLKLTRSSQIYSVSDEYIEILSAFGPLVHYLFTQGRADKWPGIPERRNPFRSIFNEFVLIVDKMSRGKTVKKVGRSRDLDERWCYWEEESFSVEAAYFLPPDSTSEYSCGTSEQDIEPNDGSSDPADSVSQTTLSSLVH